MYSASDKFFLTWCYSKLNKCKCKYITKFRAKKIGRNERVVGKLSAIQEPIHAFVLIYSLL